MMDTIDKQFLKSRLLGRENESHKGDYGHALLVCGCERMPGAALLSVGAALNSGCGLVTLHSTPTACLAAISSFPSAMLSREDSDCITDIPFEPEKYSAVAIGSGLGTDEKTCTALENFLREPQKRALVLDADAINIISMKPSMAKLIPAGTLLTPHIGELKRLFYGHIPSPDQISEFTRRYQCVMAVKGFHTKVYTPEGAVYENCTGNPGMAKGGSGDVLTGLLAGLRARGYDAVTAALLAVWIHGYAGDCLSAERTQESYSSKDICNNLYKGFKELYG